MRYVVVSKGLSLQDIKAECRKLGATNIRVAPASGQIFCDLEEGAAERLRQTPGLAVKPVGKVYTEQVIAPPLPVMAERPIYAGSQAVLASLIWEARNVLSPPLTGAGYTIAILDSGIRASHQALRGRVVYQANFTDSDSAEDRYDHGTAVAFMAAGGRPAEGEEQGVAPGARLLNIKVLGDKGEGDVESVVLGLEEVIRLKMEEAGTEREPHIANLSLGAPDDGDPDNPIRVACRAALEAGVGMVAAAGNAGPNPRSITCPATEPLVAAVGALTLRPFEIWRPSSRGPTLEGNVKPDLSFFGDSLLLASARGDDSFVVKSGTSFAAPAISGIAILGREAALRTMGEAARGWGMEQMWGLFPAISRKPPGAPVAKDNDYGFGMPFGDLMMRAFAPAAAVGMQTMMPLLALGLVGTMVTGTVRAMREKSRVR